MIESLVLAVALTSPAEVTVDVDRPRVVVRIAKAEPVRTLVQRERKQRFRQFFQRFRDRRR